jgi:hypothetical protein
MSRLDEYSVKCVSWLITLCVSITQKEIRPLEACGLLEMAARNWRENLLEQQKAVGDE